MIHKSRILHIISQKPDKTGSGVYAKSIIEQGYKRGYVQALICGINCGDELKPSFIEDKNYYPVCFDTEGVPFHVVGMSDIMPYESTRYHELDEDKLKVFKEAFKNVIDKAVTEFKPEVIISHHLWVLTAFIKELYPDIPMVAISHGTDLRQLKLNNRFSHYVIENCKNIDKVLALNEKNRSLIEEEFNIKKENINIIGSGFNKDIFYKKENNLTYRDIDKSKSLGIKSGIKTNKIEIVYAGKLSFSKGIGSLIKVINNLNISKEDLSITLIGAGVGEEGEKIKKQAESCKCSIKLTGAINQEKLGDYFRRANIFVLPSFYEGLPLVIIEALACGLRVVVNDLPGIKNWIGEDINNSGLIEYVKMPKMSSVDIPLKEELKGYEDRLKKAIETQIYRILKGDYVDKGVLQPIEVMSWEKVFEKLESFINF